MSLINEMLRNLEAKRPDDLARQGLQREIRALPPAPAGRRRPYAWLALGTVACAVVAIAVLGRWPEAALRSVVTPLPAPSAGPAAAPEAKSQPSVPTPPLGNPAPPPAAAGDASPAMAAIELQPPPDLDSLRMAQHLSFVPDPVAPSSPPAPATPALAATPAAGPQPLPVPPIKAPAQAPAEAANPPPAAGPVRIEKSPVLTTPHDRADALFRKAEAELAAGQRSAAIDLLHAALKQDAGHVQARQVLLRELLASQQTAQAMTELKAGLNLQPAQIGWAMSLARLQLEAGDLAAADRTLSASQAYAATSAEYAGFQGNLKSRLGARRDAAACYLRAARLAPAEGRWWLGLGLALDAAGSRDEAREALRRALASGNLGADLASIAEQHLK